MSGIAGLRRPEQARCDDVGAATEALHLLGLTRGLDPEVLAANVGASFMALESSGRLGVPYIHLSDRLVTLDRLIMVSDGGVYKDANGERPYPPKTAYDKYPPLPKMGVHSGQPQGRLAVFAARDDYSPCDPLLHFIGENYSDQLQAISAMKTAYEAERPGFAMGGLSLKAIVFRAFMQRIKGEPLPFEQLANGDGSLRDTTQPSDALRVACLRVDGGRLLIGEWAGVEQYWNAGVGLWVAPKK